MYSEVVEMVGDNGRICREPEQESYFAVYGEPEGYEREDGTMVSPEEEREEIWNLIDQNGVWIYFAQVKCKCCGQWETTDSIGMCIGDLDEVYREDFVRAIKEHNV